jgi:hypothetical protein
MSTPIGQHFVRGRASAPNNGQRTVAGTAGDIGQPGVENRTRALCPARGPSTRAFRFTARPRMSTTGPTGMARTGRYMDNEREERAEHEHPSVTRCREREAEGVETHHHQPENSDDEIMSESHREHAARNEHHARRK